MGYLYLVMGKSASGKDHIYQAVKEKCSFLKPVVPYTTRPMREGETEGVEYHFVTKEELDKLEYAGKIVELRCYHTIMGDWYYFTCDDGQIDVNAHSNLLIVTPEAYGKIAEYFGADNIVPIYVQVDDKTRLLRAIKREEVREVPQYAEMCRRFLADEKDFSEDILANYNIERRFINDDFDTCVDEIVEYIKDNENRG